MSKKHATESKSLMAWGRKNSVHVVAACGLLFGAGLMQSCEKDILTGQPEWLGNSIYERLQEGITVNDGSLRTFNTTLRLIDDLGYTETLSKTGSKTVFATPDDVYDRWFQEKGITYEQLTITQKKALFNNSMINNAYLLELMSNVSGNPPQEDLCMRRETAVTIYDSIPVYRVADMPVNMLADEEKDAWRKLRENGRDVRMFKDATSAPMIHFLPGFMAKNSITDDDLRVITNGQATSTAESWINGKQVISSEQTCKNGYIYVIDGVVENTQSMAEIVNDDPETSMWAGFLKRWSCPVAVTGSSLREYQGLFNTEDTVYNLRYFNSSGNHELLKVPNSDMSLSADEVLLFDPGWNQYIYSSTNKDMHYDAGALIVPTNEALTEWWNNEGKGYKEQYGTWENMPYATLASLVNVNMLESFIEAVPSKFSAVLDDGKQSALGITPADVKKCYMGSNGVVYVVDRVFAPVKYRSVIAPALQQSDAVTFISYKVISGVYPNTNQNGMEQDNTMDFTPYLNAMDSRFSVILPYNSTPATDWHNGRVFRYIDPCSYGLPQQNIFLFYIENNVVKGISYKCTIDENGVVTPITTQSKNLTSAVIKNRLYDLLDNSIIVHDYQKGEERITSNRVYYNTKAGSIMKAYRENGVMNFQGGYQMDYGQTIKVGAEDTYDMIPSNGNGVTYYTAGEDAENFIDILQTSTKSVYEVLREESAKESSKCKLFFSLLSDDASNNSLLTVADGSFKCANNTGGNKNISVFDNYNYTVYVPTDEAVQKLIDNGYLPTWEDYEEAMKEENTELATRIAERIHQFVRYHIQDRAVCIGGETVNNEQYESAMLNPQNKRYYSFTVTADNNSYTIKDQLNNVRHVVKDASQGGFYNRICREYWIKGTPGSEAATLETSSNAVVHLIDGVLLFSDSQLDTSWR